MRGRPRTHNVTCPICGRFARKKRVRGRQNCFRCPHCKRHFSLPITFESDAATELGNAKWQALSDDGDSFEWRRPRCELLAELDRMEQEAQAAPLRSMLEVPRK
jgi:hypothetical protein